MDIRKDISLKKYNTFGIDAKAKFFCEINSIADLKKALSLQGYPTLFVLGGGSNMLITKDLENLVLHINLKGIEVISENKDEAIIKVSAGENWHNMVLWTLDHDYGGLENLSLIPGNTGTAPIQNIGAYGVELKDTFVSCDAMEIATQELKTFTKEECQFGYRDSYFKNEGLGKYIITSVSFKLTKRNHKLNVDYGAIVSELHISGITNPSIKDVSNAVIAIRKSKLPDPKELGNSGSFFKNPVVDKQQFDNFTKMNPTAPFYKVTENEFKIPAGWLIEQCGYKGKRFGDAGVHKNQALVLVNYGDASGAEIIDLAENIIDSVSQRFGIVISPEVNIIK
ncbi:UDP-N-acetylmuramate dehydrogenase [Arenibacter algicola]|uniref:UDP-N-acetylenolpyruvoylglucosamine reductase n=1 Tax=Arenibacter algicola TaxID=616991 RepID=A0A221UQF5_9FLAO|nr:UDP-N-acetylmuramate dehydrogenase [Arenibacter algicola]ASO03587.1 UDP-N-acetylenolpyruvoylglucosamine reductase [Arenibacter algicola]|tara:strand:+ start:5683 stop:6699 length:1017 start_codon:yes stop_codon:yes gene_type:complete